MYTSIHPKNHQSIFIDPSIQSLYWCPFILQIDCSVQYRILASTVYLLKSLCLLFIYLVAHLWTAFQFLLVSTKFLVVWRIQGNYWRELGKQSLLSQECDYGCDISIWPWSHDHVCLQSIYIVHSDIQLSIGPPARKPYQSPQGLVTDFCVL